MQDKHISYCQVLYRHIGCVNGRFLKGAYIGAIRGLLYLLIDFGIHFVSPSAATNQRREVMKYKQNGQRGKLVDILNLRNLKSSIFPQAVSSIWRR